MTQIYNQPHHSHRKTKIWALLNCILSSRYRETFDDTKFEKNQETPKNFKSLLQINEITCKRWSNWRSWQNLSNEKFFQAHNSHQKTKKMSIATLNSVQYLQRNCWWQTLYPNRGSNEIYENPKKIYLNFLDF